MLKIDSRKNYASLKEIDIIRNNISENRILCKHCGHSLVMPEWETKRLCTHCGYYVFKNDKEEFKYRMKEGVMKK